MGAAESCERKCVEQTNSFSLSCSKSGDKGQDFFTCCSSQSASIETTQRILAQRALTPRGFGPQVVRVIRKATPGHEENETTDSGRESKDSFSRPWHKPSDIRGIAAVRIPDSFNASPHISISSTGNKSRAPGYPTAIRKQRLGRASATLVEPMPSRPSSPHRCPPSDDAPTNKSDSAAPIYCSVHAVSVHPHAALGTDAWTSSASHLGPAPPAPNAPPLQAPHRRRTPMPDHPPRGAGAGADAREAVIVQPLRHVIQRFPAAPVTLAPVVQPARP
jgi:hypothetical protein